MKRPLCDLLTGPSDEAADNARDQARRVAFGGEGERSSRDLLHDVFSLTDALAGDAGKRWLVDTEDAYRVAVTVLAAAVVGARVVLPPNVQPGTLAKLAAECDRVLAESPQQPRVGLRVRAAGGAGLLDPLDPGRRAERAGAATRPVLRPVLSRQTPLVELFTSGSSGPEKLVCKGLCHLEDEVVELENELGEPLGVATPVFATVSPRHLYGLLVRVLWPLAAGRPLARGSFLLPDELLPQIVAAGRAVLVATPVHLRHLAASSRLTEAAPCLVEVFSSGGPLEAATARALESAIGRAPVEIFGSTETGGVAYRRSSSANPDANWRCLAPVRIDCDSGQLTVTSPFVTAPAGAEITDGGSWRMGDRAVRSGDGFRLLGRADRVVNIGEKSFSLPALEASLVEHGSVEATALVAYRSGGEQRVGAVVVLTRAGRQRLAALGRRALSRELAEHLARHWDRIALPRRWRFRAGLPIDERGKVTLEALEAELADAAGPVVEAVLLEQSREAGQLLRRLVVPTDLAYLDGHYDRFPLVPGVVQIHWVMAALADLLGTDVAPERMEAIKFKDVLRPGQAFSLSLDVDAATRRAGFSLADGDHTFSSGRIFWQSPPQAPAAAPARDA